MQTIQKEPTQKGAPLSVGGIKTQETLSDMIIPAVPGEYYAYSSEFTCDKPLYVFMKCRANKNRTIASAEQLGREANLFFRFNTETCAHVYSIKTANACGMLDEFLNNELFGETWVAPAGITPEMFYEHRSNKNVSALVEICKSACSGHQVSADLKPGVVIAMMTDAGKYGMFLVTKLTATSVSVDACHILL